MVCYSIEFSLNHLNPADCSIVHEVLLVLMRMALLMSELVHTHVAAGDKPATVVQSPSPSDQRLHRVRCERLVHRLQVIRTRALRLLARNKALCSLMLTIDSVLSSGFGARVASIWNRDRPQRPWALLFEWFAGRSVSRRCLFSCSCSCSCSSSCIRSRRSPAFSFSFGFIESLFCPSIVSL